MIEYISKYTLTYSFIGYYLLSVEMSDRKRQKVSETDILPSVLSTFSTKVFYNNLFFFFPTVSHNDADQPPSRLYVS